MSFSRKKYDKSCLTNQNNNDSSINNYLLNMPENDCDNCFPSNPEIRYQKKSVRENTNVENDLFGINRKDTCDDTFHSCKDGTCKTQEFDNVDENNNLNDCSINTVNSRFNSVKNLKELSANRWQWLPIDPQKHAISDINALSSRNYIKDNYKPEFDTPNNVSNTLTTKQIESKYTVPVKVNPF